MSYIGDLSTYMNAGAANNAATKQTSSTKDKLGLDMTDFLMLMVAQFQNQSIDNTADTSEMLNQLVQMQMVQALVNMTDASVMSYAASLVGKEVTIGGYDGNGNFKEITGTVTATGTYGGQQVIFVGDQYYYLSEIMAVGRLPKVEEGDGTEKPGDGTPPVDGTEKPPVDGTDEPTEKPPVTQPDEPQNPAE